MSTALEKDILEANKKYASRFTSGGLPLSPAKKVAIVTCMDSRLDPAAAYGFGPGDAIILRNAGASSRDAARSALAASHLLGAEDIYIVKHTRCGLLGATTEMVHDVMKKNLGLTESKDVDEFVVLPIADLQQSAEEDVAFLRSHPLAVKTVRVTGWIHDTDTGLIKKVVE